MGLVGVEKVDVDKNQPRVEDPLKEEATTIALAIGAEHIVWPLGIHYLHGTTPDGSHFSLRLKELTRAVRICEVAVWNRENKIDSRASLLNPQVDLTDGVRIKGVNGDYLKMGPRIPITIYHAPNGNHP